MCIGVPYKDVILSHRILCRYYQSKPYLDNVNMVFGDKNKFWFPGQNLSNNTDNNLPYFIVILRN